MGNTRACAKAGWQISSAIVPSRAAAICGVSGVIANGGNGASGEGVKAICAGAGCPNKLASGDKGCAAIRAGRASAGRAAGIAAAVAGATGVLAIAVAPATGRLAAGIFAKAIGATACAAGVAVIAVAGTA